MTKVLERQARATDGCQLAYRLYDNGATDRLVLIHSLALDGSVWTGVVAALGDSADILVVDCRGHGRSDAGDGPYDDGLFADDVAAVMDDCGWPSALVVGCSMGGCVAQAFAVRHRSRTVGLGLIDTTAWYGPEAPEQWRARADKAAAEGLDGLIGFQLSRWFSEQFAQANPEVAERLSSIFVGNDIGAYQKTCAMMGAFDRRNELHDFAGPAAVVVGEDDYATPVAMAEALHRSIPGSTLTVLAAGRHLTPVEQPAQIAAAITALARRVLDETTQKA